MADFSPAQRIRRGFGRCSSSLSGNDEEHHWKDAPTWEKVGVVASGTSKPQGKKGDLRAVTKYLGSGLHVLRDMRGVAWRLAPEVMKLNFNDPSTTQSLPSSLSTTHHASPASSLPYTYLATPNSRSPVQVSRHAFMSRLKQMNTTSPICNPASSASPSGTHSMNNGLKF